MLKFHGGQKYTSDAMTSGNLRTLCKGAGVSCQSYHNRSDIAGGSTLGNISTAHVSIPSVDIGLAQWASIRQWRQPEQRFGCVDPSL